jgi:diguanylate cyclase (GGDEF)-like protein
MLERKKSQSHAIPPFASAMTSTVRQAASRTAAVGAFLLYVEYLIVRSKRRWHGLRSRTPNVSRDLVETLDEHRQIAPAYLVIFAGATVWVSLRTWIQVVRRLDRAFVALTDVLAAEDLEGMASALAVLVSKVLKTKDVAVLVRVDPNSTTFQLAASLGAAAPDLINVDPGELDALLSVEGAKLHRVGGLKNWKGIPLRDGENVFGLVLVKRGDLTLHRALPLVQRSALTRISEIAAVSALREAAQKDPLTRIPNRRFFDEAVSMLEKGDAVALIDLDHFKAVNDRLGHSGGDEVLRTFAKYLARVASGDDCAARVGGEEFALLVRRSNQWRARVLLEGLYRDWKSQNPATTFSAGVAEHVGGEPSETVDAADRALYQSKADGRDRITVARRG